MPRSLPKRKVRMYEINADIARKLKTMRGIKEFDEQGRETALPSNVRAAFLQWEKYFHRAGGSVLSDADLATVCCLADFQLLTAPQEPVIWSATNEIANGRLKYDDAVTVVWKDKKQSARVLGLGKGGKVKIQLENDSHEREVPAHTVLPFEQPPAQSVPIAAM